MAETYGVDSAIVSSVAAAKTMIGIATGSTTSNRVIRHFVASDYTTIATPINVKVELTTWSSDGTGSAYTPKKINGEAQNRASIATAKTNYTVEPTSPTVVQTDEALFPGSARDVFGPLGRELGYMAASAFMGLRCTPGASIDLTANWSFEE